MLIHVHDKTVLIPYIKRMNTKHKSVLKWLLKHIATQTTIIQTKSHNNERNWNNNY